MENKHDWYENSENVKDFTNVQLILQYAKSKNKWMGLFYDANCKFGVKKIIQRDVRFEIFKY